MRYRFGGRSVVVILRCLSSSSSVSFIIQRRDDEKRERERERERVICINTKERRENSFKVWLISCCCCFKQTLADEFCFNFFSRKNLLSQTTTTEQQHQYSYRTIAFRRDNIIHFTRKSNQNQSCLRSTTRW